MHGMTLSGSFSPLGIRVHSAFKIIPYNFPPPLWNFSNPHVSMATGIQRDQGSKGGSEFNFIKFHWSMQPPNPLRVQQFRWFPSESSKYDLLEAPCTCRNCITNDVESFLWSSFTKPHFYQILDFPDRSSLLPLLWSCSHTFSKSEPSPLGHF